MPGVCLIYAKDMPYAGKIRIFIEYNQLYPDRPLALADYLHYYNNKRPHRALGMKTPGAAGA